MSLDDDFFLCVLVCCERKEKISFFYSILAVLSFLFEEEVKEISSLYLKKKTQAHQTLRFFSLRNTHPRQ